MAVAIYDRVQAFDDRGAGIMAATLLALSLVAILDAGAYGMAMASNCNARGRLAALVAAGGRLRRCTPCRAAAPA